MYLTDGHLLRIPHGAVERRRPLGRQTPLYLGHLILISYLEQYVLVPTPEAMAFNLHHFKSLVDNPKFSTIVTNITVDGLDEMKKTSKEARDTTR